jgi:hypothetical protein
MRPRALCLGPLMLGLVVAGCRNDEGLELPTVNGDSGADAGKGGAGGAVVVSGGGGSGAGGGAGGAVGGAGGSAGGGGWGGSIGGGGGNAGAGGNAGKGGAGGTTDAGPPRDGPLMCGPVCAIFCPYGNVLDDRGCPTCQCNPQPVICRPVACKLFCANGYQKDAKGCDICACNPPPGECRPAECPSPPPSGPTMICADGTTGGPVCQRTDTGRCAWIYRNCPEGHCGDARTAAACAAAVACRWLEPGCTEPRLSVAGCYTRTLIDCETRGCPAGRQCVKRVINPCADSGALAGTSPVPAIIPPPPPVCTACAFSISLCL